MNQSIKITRSQAFKYVLIVIFFQVLLWTVLPYIFLGALPFDTSESIAWGMQWQLGYDKMPPFTPWLLAPVYELFGVFGVYLFAQVVIVVALLSMWKISQEFFENPMYSFLGVVLLQGNLSFTFVSPYINPNAMLVPLFALLMLVFYYAIKTNKLGYWALVGLLAACNLLDKYQCAIIFIVIIIFMLYNAEARKRLASFGPYLAILVAVILVIPHFYHSYFQGFPEVQYALYSTVSEMTWSARIRDPFQMTINQLGTIAPMLVMLLAFCGRREQKFSPEYTTRFKKQYLFFMALGCFLVTIIFGFITGSKMNNNWFVPYFPMIGIALVYVIRPKVTPKRLKIFIVLLAVVMIALPASRFIAIAVNPYKLGYPNSNAYFPAEAIAAKVQEEWKINNKQNMPLDYVAGDHYVAAYMTTYIPSHPMPFLDWSLQESPWINVDNMMKKGAMFVWMAKDNPHVVNSRVNSNTLPEHVLKCFPNVKPLGVFDFKPASIANLPPSVRVGMAYLPSSNMTSPCSSRSFTGNDY